MEKKAKFFCIWLLLLIVVNEHVTKCVREQCLLLTVHYSLFTLIELAHIHLNFESKIHPILELNKSGAQIEWDKCVIRLLISMNENEIK